MGLYKYHVYSDLELCFQGQMKVCEGLGLSLQDFYMFCIQMLMKWRLVGVGWGIAWATVNVTGLG